MLFILDTNIIIQIARGRRTYFIENFGLDNPSNFSIISLVSIAETRSFAMQNTWGETKWQRAENLFEEFRPVDINDPNIIKRYAEIDTFSKGKLIGRPIVGSSRTMGKNDLWIAATASILNATLLTTDKDFDHLNNEFLRVIYVEPSSIV
jgi:tRNA(fMet)-specific endonuclease VapC